MKLIKLNEAQYNRLFEISKTVASLGITDNPDACPPKSSSQISSQGGEVEGEGGVIGTTDNFQGTMTNNMRRWGNRF